MALASLSNLPNEVAWQIIEGLDLPSLQSLRLVNTTLVSQCNIPQWLSYFETRQTDLSADSLKELAQLAAHPVLGKAVKTINIIALVFDIARTEKELRTKSRPREQIPGAMARMDEEKIPEEQLKELEADLTWLTLEVQKQKDASTQTLTSQLANIFHDVGVLETIELTAEVVWGPKAGQRGERPLAWPLIWPRASEVFRITTSAIALSRVKTKSLLCYRSNPVCSVQTFDVTQHTRLLQEQSFEETGKHIKDFALNVSPRVVDILPNMEEAPARTIRQHTREVGFGPLEAGLSTNENEPFRGEVNFPRVARLLAMMPNLEALDLNMRQMCKGSPHCFRQVSLEIANTVRVPSLQQVSLRGLLLTEDSLIKFFSNHPKLEEIDLEEAHILQSESWQRVINHMIANLPRLKKLHFRNLWTGDTIQHLGLKSDTVYDPRSIQSGIPPPPNTMSCTGGYAYHTRTFDREQIQAGLNFVPFDTSQPQGSYLAHTWRNDRARNFGPPQSPY